MRKITTLNPGEVTRAEYTKGGVDFAQLPDDPLGLRISIGQLPLTPPDGVDAYCVYRGERAKIAALLQRVLASIT